MYVKLFRIFEMYSKHADMKYCIFNYKENVRARKRVKTDIFHISAFKHSYSWLSNLLRFKSNVFNIILIRFYKFFVNRETNEQSLIVSSDRKRFRLFASNVTFINSEL